jgi:hypothetical protein
MRNDINIFSTHYFLNLIINLKLGYVEIYKKYMCIISPCEYFLHQYY